MKKNNEIPKFEIQNPAKVYFIKIDENENVSSIAKKTELLIQRANFSSLIAKNSISAVKQHFGEKGNENYIKPEISKIVIEMIKKEEASPLLVETNTLYKGERSDSYHHLMLAYDHGFSIEKLGAPVVIMDGLNGQVQNPVSIPGKHFKEVNLVSDIPFFNSIFVLSHVKGHMMSGMGGTIKNLGMGFASRAGKLAQHDDFRPEVNSSNCIGCELCIKYCPEQAIKLDDSTPPVEIDHEICIGCGECFTACRNDAISFQWADADRKFNEKMAEHAFGAIINHNNKIGYLNYLIDITRHCDCWEEDNPVIYKNIGIFASFDPVAIDQACQDMSVKALGKDVFKEMWPELDATIQLKHGEDIGMGTRNYDLIELS